MITRLSISNYALISKVEISFAGGLTIITGETGSGKSIMLGALSLLLGGRADTRAVRKDASKSIVEAVFTADTRLRKLFDDNGLDWDDTGIIIRREVSASGRSRAFINDTPVTLKLLGEATSGLIDIHSQDSNVMLKDPRRQLEIIDSLADNASLLDAYHAAYRDYVKLRNQLRSAREEISRNRENENFLRFQVEQLDKLKPHPGELEALEMHEEVLADAEEINEHLTEAEQLLEEPEYGVLSRLAEVRRALSKVNLSLLEEPGEQGAGIMQRLESVYVELKDISPTISAMREKVDDDPETLEKIQTRISRLYEAIKRFRVPDVAALARMHTDLKNRLASLSTSETDLSEMERELHDKGKVLKEAADKLSESRSAAAEKFSALLVDKARPLGLANLKFSTLLTKGKLTSDGQDNIQFLCAFNKNQELMPIEAVASGGETSRLTLSIKAIIADHLSLPSIIFDEVDTGVSGDVADRMGTMMRDLGEKIQVIAITHLPQVAAKGHTHYKVYKADNEEQTVTNISLLDKAGREAEIAMMLSGATVDDAALLNARSLLEHSRR